MGRMISIEIDSDDMIEALVDRVGYWTDDSEVIEVFEQFYESRVEGGCFDGSEFNVMSIVDNDYVNNLSIVTRGEFEEARDKYIEESEDEEAPEWEDIEYGENNIEFLEGSYVEAKTDRCLLVSW